MKKILVGDDTIIIDGEEFTKEEIKKAFVEQYKFHQLSDFIRNGGVSK